MCAPGVGKSTLLNCLLGIPVFKSGVSFGGGMTQALQMYKDPDGNVFADTPGLADSATRGIAAQEIERGLTKGGAYKIFFVVVLKSGRVCPEDIKTIKLILDTAPQIQSNYSIIINKVPIRTLQHLSKDGLPQINRLFTTPQNSTPPPIFYNTRCQELEDTENCIAPLGVQLKQFLNDSPQVIISPSRVGRIQTSAVEKQHEELCSQLSSTKDSNTALADMIAKQREQITQLKLQHEREIKELQDQRKQEREEYDNERRREQCEYDDERWREDNDYNTEKNRKEQEFENKWDQKRQALKDKHVKEDENMMERHNREEEAARSDENSAYWRYRGAVGTELEDKYNGKYAKKMQNREQTEDRHSAERRRFEDRREREEQEFEILADKSDRDFRNQLDRQEVNRTQRQERRDRERQKREDKRDADRQKVEETMDREWEEFKAQRSRELETLAQRHEAEQQLLQCDQGVAKSNHKREREDLAVLSLQSKRVVK